MDHEIPSVGRFEGAHGRQAELGETLTFVAVPDGVRPAEPVSTEPPAPRNDGRFTSQSAKQAARRRHELAKRPDFASKELEFVPLEAFAPFDAGRRDLLTAKATELCAMVGSVGAGVMTTVRGYAWCVSFAEFYAVRFAKTGNDDDAARAAKFAKDASIELAKAHELARAEAAARPRDPAAEGKRLIAAFGAPEAKGGSK